MSNENPAINPTVDADAGADSWSVALAKKHAHATAVAESHAEGSELLTFEPAEWVVNAIREAHDMGMLQGRTDGNAVAEAQHEQHQIERTGMVRATIAAVLEAQKGVFDHAQQGQLPYVHLDPTTLATVFDRVDLDFVQADDGTLIYTLHEGARRHDGAA